jgi:D-alanyl-D-alanine carboxypeptidase/D-alanyl-D-alanine-endopeptidase (penicillin-binding protein 4)
MMVQVRLFGTLTLFLFALSCPAFGIDSARLQEIVYAHHLNPDDLGIIIEDENGKLFALNETKKLKPASLAKILTAGAALEYLGSDFEFKTEMLSDGSIGNHTLSGSLYLRAGGDPAFNKEKLPLFVGALQKKGVRLITGNIVIDDSLYSDIRARDSRSWLASLRSSGNYPLFINLDPPSKLVPLSRQWLKAERRLRRLMYLNDGYVTYQNMAQPDLWTGQRFQNLLKRAGIRVKGKVIRGEVPSDALLLSTVSNPITKVIHEMLKSSNNFYADMMIRNLAAEAGEKPATVRAGMEFIYTFLDHVGIPRDEYLLSSGAGFTHSNFISAGALCKILNHLKAETSVSSAFFSSLPVAGVDGTLKTRMRRTPAQGKIHAKTGYLGRIITKFRKLDGVVALGGFANSSNGKVVTFVFLYNGIRPPSAVRAIFDKICVELVKEPIDSPPALQ